MMTSSPGSQTARTALKQDCFAPLLTMIWLGLYSRLLSFLNFSEMAWRSSGMPELGVYLVKPASNGFDAGGLDMLGGVHVRLAGPEAADIDAFGLERLGLAVDGEGEGGSEFLDASCELHDVFRRGGLG